jgi:glycosyltransferase involved in cell wall biosynthesis
MRILHLIDSLDTGGGEKMCVQLANLFDVCGYQIGVVHFRATKNSFANLLNAGVQQHFIKKQLWNPIFYAKVASLANTYDVIHVHLTSTIKVVLVSDLFFKIKCRKVIFHSHTGSKRLYEMASTDYILAKAIGKYLVVNVFEDREVTIKPNCCPNETKEVCIPNFVARPPYTKLNVKKQRDGQIDILVLGNIKEIKHQDFLIPLFNALKSRGKEVGIHVCGKIQDHKYFERLNELIEKNRCAASFKFYHSFDAFYEIPLAIDLALMVSKSESGPLVNIEYLLLNVPFITYDVGNVTQTLKKYVPDRIIPNFDTEVWASKILELYSQESSVVQLMEIYEFNFSDEIAFGNWCRIYN